MLYLLEVKINMVYLLEVKMYLLEVKMYLLEVSYI